MWKLIDYVIVDQGIAIYRAEGDYICYVEQLVDLSFDQVLKAVKDQSLHEVFVRQPPRTLFVVNATVCDFIYQLSNISLLFKLF